MKTSIKILFMAIAILFLHNNILAQGCSDAGFCTINSFKPNHNDSTPVYKNQIKTGLFLGKADNNILAYGNYLEYNRTIKDNLGIDIKLTSLGQGGNDISTLGIADLFVTLNYQTGKKLKWIGGLKVPLTTADKSKNNLALPMDYQASLGTFDLIFGIGYAIKKLQLVAAIQQPLTQNNNQFISTQYPVNSNLSRFQSTNKFIRSGDVLVRISYPLVIKPKLKFTPSLLPIYHLTQDKYTDEFNNQKSISGSDGLTLNGNVYFDYELNNKNTIQINFGMPFIVRPVRPDGLTRSLIGNIEYRVKF
jgi:hypothetical protein